jgi:hypothetical protein
MIFHPHSISNLNLGYRENLGGESFSFQPFLASCALKARGVIGMFATDGIRLTYANRNKVLILKIYLGGCVDGSNWVILGGYLWVKVGDSGTPVCAGVQNCDR